MRVANDADCFALSEADRRRRGGRADGVRRDPRHRHRRRRRGRTNAWSQGPNAIAGEWGHNPLPWPRDDERPGPACYCGRTGCIETFLSGPAIAREYAAAARLAPGDAAPDAAAIATRAAAGEALAESIVVRYEDRLARGLASIINVLDPHVIVLGGGLSNLTRLYDNVPRVWPAWSSAIASRHAAGARRRTATRPASAARRGCGRRRKPPA